MPIRQRPNTSEEKDYVSEIAKLGPVVDSLVDKLSHGLSDTINDKAELAYKKLNEQKKYYEEILNKNKKTEEKIIDELYRQKKQNIDNLTEIAMLQAQMQDNAYLALVKQNKVLAQQKALMHNITEEIASAYGGTLDPAKLEKLIQIKTRLAEEKSARQQADDFRKEIPLIGKKLGELGDIRPLLTAMSNRRATTRKAKETAREASMKYLGRQDSEDKTVQKENAKAVRDLQKQQRTKRKEIRDDKEKSAALDKLTELFRQGRPKDEGEAALYDREREDAMKALYGKAANEQLDDKEKAQAEALAANTAKQEEQNKALSNSINVLANIAQQLTGLADEIALNKGKVDTRLQGSQDGKILGSYWEKIVWDTSALIASPLIKQKDLYDNVIKVVQSGIARDVEQMAMLETIKDKIATTFNTFDGTLLRLIRIQDQNTTAARLGMEASLNEFLNSMYSTTEYLQNIASSVRNNLEEAQALMGGTEATEFEYQVQKWLGSMYSVGMSQTGVTNISSALGKLAAGDIEGITSGGIGNLLVMAANNSNQSIGEILADGLDASKTNDLLLSAVKYLSDLYDEANGNKVVQQQLAKVFGLTASDVKSVKNIMTDTAYTNANAEAIYDKSLTYDKMIGNLYDSANDMFSRMSTGEILTNLMENVKYSTAGGMSLLPMMIATKTADVLDSFVSGLQIPSVMAAGFGVDPKLTVASILRSGSLVGGFAASLVSALTSGGQGFTGSGLLNMVGLENTSSMKRKNGSSERGQAKIVNGGYEDIKGGAEQEGSDTVKKQTNAAKEEAADEVTNETINTSIVDIYNLISEIVSGTKSLTTKKDTAFDTGVQLLPTLLDGSIL